jgi:beta-galactosidase
VNASYFVILGTKQIMKSMKSLLLFLLLIFPTWVSAQYQEVKTDSAGDNRPLALIADRQRVLWNFDWKFRLVTDANRKDSCMNLNYDDRAWRRVDLPHDFQFEQPWTRKGGGARGYNPMCEGWYRKSFTVDESWRGLRVTLDVGGIVYLGDVYINGHKVASTEYGYVGFEADITPYLLYGRTNVVAVYASTGPTKGSRWYTGGGLFRDVYLKMQNPTHISRHGVFVHTPQVTDKQATVALQVEVEGWRNHDISVVGRIVDADNRVVTITTGRFNGPSHASSRELVLPEMTVISPRLWSIEHPALYHADVVVYDRGVAVDSVRETFGIRQLEFSPKFGFKINGRKVFIQGCANHHDMGAVGAASYDRAIERMMLRLKSFGFNAIRCSHNPYSESFTKIADRVGMLIIDELIDKWSDKDYWGGRRPFTSIWPALIKEWVTRDRNSPSVVMWSLGNELQIRQEWSGFEGMNDWGVTTYRVFDTVVKRFDPTRKTTVAQFPARAGAVSRRDKEFGSWLVPPELACATEVASLNYQSEHYEDYYRYKPDLTIFQSEAETQKLLAPLYNMNRERSVGLAYWGAVEYWGESKGWPQKGWNFSFFDHTMHPYPQAYLIKSAFCPDEPLVRIGVVDARGGETMRWNDVEVGRDNILDHWNYPSGSKLAVVTYTNAYEVELFVNGRSVGRKRNDETAGERRNCIFWDAIDYDTGGRLTAVAYDAQGKETARHELQTAGKAVRLRIEKEDGTPWKADGNDLLYFHVYAEDAQGRTVPTYADSLEVTVSGPASLLAIDNGDHATDDLFLGVSGKPMRHGQMMGILRAGRQSGKVTVSVRSGKMKGRLTVNLGTRSKR